MEFHTSRERDEEHFKTKSIMPRHENQVNFDHPHKDQVNSEPYIEIKSISISHNEIKSISTTRTKNKSISMLPLKPSDFRIACKSQVIFDHPHRNQINRSPY